MIRLHADELPTSRPFRPARVVVAGGDLVAHLAALALKEWKPELEVTLVGPPARAGTIASAPALVPFVLGYLGVDPLRFGRAVAPTLRLGARYEWGQAAPAYFNAAFGDGDLVDAMAHDRDPLRYGVSSQLMSAGRTPFARVGGRVISLLKDTRFGWHLDEARAVAFLRERARAVGVGLIDAPLGELEVVDASGQPGSARPSGIPGAVRRAVVAGDVIAADLWVDCAGALADALGVPWESYAGSLVADAVVTATVPGDDPPPFGTVTTMNAGWAWVVPLRDEARVGYVHAARFADPDAAAAELVERFPGARDLAHQRFAPGRRAAVSAGNVVALGAAYGVVEPLGAHGTQLAVATIGRLLALLDGGGNAGDARKLDAHVGAQWDWVRWLYALCYRFNRRLDTPFWREAHMTDWSGLEDVVRDFLAHGPLSQRARDGRDAGRASSEGLRESIVAAREIDLWLFGQGVAPASLAPATTASEWHELTAMRAALVACAVPQRQAWSELDDARTWNELVHDERSWCRQATAEMQRATATRGRSQDALAFWTKELGVPAVLGREAQHIADEFPTSPNIDYGKFLRRVPEVVLRPKDQGQLAECLQMCARRRMPMRVRGAGHTSGGQTLADEGAVIDLRWLKRVVAESPDEPRIRVESGMWWLELCGHLRARGRRPLVLTSSWRQTIGGTLAVGGFGDATHREGLQIAGVREMTVMTIDGTRHRVRPSDDLFDWSLAGRGQLGVITEVVLETIDRGYDLHGRMLRWATLDAFLADARVIVAEGRFDWQRARVNWAAGYPVTAVAGHFGGGGASDFMALGATLGQHERIDVYETSTAPPDEARWEKACPAMEVIVPIDAAGLAALHEILRRVMASGLGRWCPQNSSAIMALPGRDALRFPMAPVPPGDVVFLLAVRPELPLELVPRFMPMLQSLGDVAVDAGGKVYLLGLEPTRPGWLERQLGAERYRRLVALKSKWDPDGLLNPGLL